jgi:hypothetical protein
MSTSSEGRSTGSGRSSTALTRLKMVALTPIPRAIVTIATRVKAGDLRTPRRAYRRSRRSSSIVPVGWGWGYAVVYGGGSAGVSPGGWSAPLQRRSWRSTTRAFSPANVVSFDLATESPSSWARVRRTGPGMSNPSRSCGSTTQHGCLYRSAHARFTPPCEAKAARVDPARGRCCVDPAGRGKPSTGRPDRVWMLPFRRPWPPATRARGSRFHAPGPSGAVPEGEARGNGGSRHR